MNYSAIEREMRTIGKDLSEFVVSSPGDSSEIAGTGNLPARVTPVNEIYNFVNFALHRLQALEAYMSEEIIPEVGK